MARQQAVLREPKLIAGAVLIGLGLLILFRNLAEVAELSRCLRITGDEVASAGMLTAAGTTAHDALQAYLFNHTEFMRAFYQTLLSFSALLLIIVGTTCFAGVLTAGAKEIKKKEQGHVDFTVPRSTRK
jgi:putative Mn2+ efflux pump MntP